MKNRVLILGAGLSGLSAAVHLILKGYQVTILEKRPFAGGRTFSFSKDFWPFPIDNGPHVLLGCYSSLLELLEIAGSKTKLFIQPKLKIPYLLPDQDPAFLTATSLPAPFHLLAAMFKFPLLNLKEKLSIIKVFLKIQKLTEELFFDQLTAQEWLVNAQQKGRIMEVFWRPLTLATLNSSPDKVSFLQLFRVLKIGFLRGKEESGIIFMPEGLNETLINPIIEWLGRQKCQIDYRRVVKKIEFKNGQIEQVVTGQQNYRQFDILVSALPFKSLLKVLNDSDGLLDINNLLAFKSNVIVNFHFWYEGRLILEHFAAFLNCTSQWLFVQKSQNGNTHHTIIVSDANEFLLKNKEEMKEMFLSDLKRTFSGFERTKIVHSCLTIEKNATLHCLPGAEVNRPEIKPYFKNLFLAGDWTKTGLPPTMEGAVLSGKNVAEKIMELF